MYFFLATSSPKIFTNGLKGRNVYAEKIGNWRNPEKTGLNLALSGIPIAIKNVRK